MTEEIFVEFDKGACEKNERVVSPGQFKKGIHGAGALLMGCKVRAEVVLDPVTRSISVYVWSIGRRNA